MTATAEEVDGLLSVSEQELNGSSLHDAIPNRLAKEYSRFFVEYGVRSDDGAIVMHFYASARFAKEALTGFVSNRPLDWTEGFERRLVSAIRATFGEQPTRDEVEARYTEEYDSYCLILRRLGAAPDPWPLVERFFHRIDESD